MKRFLIAASLAVATLSTPSFAADVGVSVNIGQPGFFGRLDIGGFPPPPLLFPQPMMIRPVPMSRPPLYLRVPPGHARHWAKYCHRYNACGERVFFVQDNWYQREYAPRYQERHAAPRDYDRGAYRQEYRAEERRDYRRDERRDVRREERRDERRDYRGDERGRADNGDRGRGNEHRDHGRHGRDD